jgi:hypothetical protein
MTYPTHFSYIPPKTGVVRVYHYTSSMEFLIEDFGRGEHGKRTLSLRVGHHNYCKHARPGVTVQCSSTCDLYACICRNNLSVCLLANRITVNSQAEQLHFGKYCILCGIAVSVFGIVPFGCICNFSFSLG